MEKFNPLVSIVIPAYNASNFIREALDSALNQTYKNVEIVVVNDGSTDNGETEKICLSYGDKIRYYKKENGGCSSALNYAIKVAKGDYISWLSHDDLYENNKIEHQISLYEEKKLDKTNTIISNHGKLINSNGEIIPHPFHNIDKFYNGFDSYKFLMYRFCYNGCGLLLPKNLFTENNMWFDETMRFVLDWNMWLKFVLNGVSVYIDSAYLVKNRVHGGQVTVKQKQLYNTETEQTILQLFEIVKQKPKEYLDVLYIYAYARKSPHFEKIKLYYKENKLSRPRCKAQRKRLKFTFINFAKKIYHKIIK